MSISIPSDLTKAKAIIVLGQDAIFDAAQSKETGAFLFDPAVQVIQLPVPERYIRHSPELRMLNEKKLLKENTMIIPHPYEVGNYIEVDEGLGDVVNTTLQKARVFMNFCGALGAQKVSFSEKKITREEDNVSGSIGIDAKTVGVKAGGEKKFKSAIMQKIEVERTFSSNAIDIDKAMRIAGKNGLSRDKLFLAVLDSCEIGLEIFEEKISLTSDVAKSINALLDVGVKMPAFKTPSSEESEDVDSKKGKNSKNKKPTKKQVSSPGLLKIKSSIDLARKDYEEVELIVYVRFNKQQAVPQ